MAAVMAAPPPLEKKYDGYFQYANVPGEKEYEFGFNRGNAAHYASRYEQSKDHRFRTKVWNIYISCRFLVMDLTWSKKQTIIVLLFL